MTKITTLTLSGSAASDYIPELARLRMQVFREFPYLYDGDLAYEETYLQTYARSEDTVIVLALNEGKVIGASTGMPMELETGEVQAPFLKRGYDPGEIFYFGESVLDRAFRGQGLGGRFFQEREAHARRLGRFAYTTFCAVQRPDDHARRPADYRPLDEFWKKRGYEKHPELHTHFSWKDVDEEGENEKRMVFWLKELGKSAL